MTAANGDPLLSPAMKRLIKWGTAVTALAGLWTSAAFFGVELPRPAWRTELDSNSCKIARIHKDYYGRKLKRAEENLLRLSEEGKTLTRSDEGYWRNRVDRSNAEDEVIRQKLIVDPAMETWVKCTK